MDLRFVLAKEIAEGGLLAVANNVAQKPYQFRILVPYLARLLLHLNIWPFDSPGHVARALETLATLAALLAFRWYVSLFIKSRPLVLGSSLILLLVLPFQYLFPRILPVLFCQDLPSVAFFTIGLACLYKQKWAVYYPLFVLATLNRETTCFLTVVYLFVRLGRDKPARIAAHVLIQLAIWIGERWLLAQCFASNGGPANGYDNGLDIYLYEDAGLSHLRDNLRYFTLANLPFFLSNIGFLWVVVAIGYRRIPDLFVRRSVLVSLPMFAGMMVVGTISEIRIFGELVPVFSAAFLLLLETSMRNARPGASPSEAVHAG